MKSKKAMNSNLKTRESSQLTHVCVMVDEPGILILIQISVGKDISTQVIIQCISLGNGDQTEMSY